MRKGFRSIIPRAVPWPIRRLVPQFIFKHLYFDGEFDFFFDGRHFGKLLNTSSAIENNIFWRGLRDGHEPFSMEIWIRLCEGFKPGRILDIGANSGIYGLLAKLSSPESEIHFFEPSIEAKGLIEKSMQINSFTDGYFIHNIALSNHNAKHKAFKAISNGGIPYTYLTRIPEEISGEITDVTERRLEDYLNELFIDSFELVKIDIEGYESVALSGFGNLLGEQIFLIEILDDAAAKKLSFFFPAAHYSFYNIDEAKRIMRKQDKLSKACKYNFLIVPTTKEISVKTVLDSISFD